jgi:hypothetical protein
MLSQRSRVARFALVVSSCIGSSVHTQHDGHRGWLTCLCTGWLLRSRRDGLLLRQFGERIHEFPSPVSDLLSALQRPEDHAI